MIPPVQRAIEPAHKALYVFLFLMWIAGTGVMTLKAPFLQTGNGFFGAWFALYASTSLTYKAFQGWDGAEGELSGGGGGGGGQGFNVPEAAVVSKQPDMTPVGAV